MRGFKMLLVVVAFLTFGAGSATSTSVSLKLSGPGAVNDSTIKVGEKVSFDVYLVNDTVFTGFTMGFRLTSPDIKKIVHMPDSAGGLNEAGDVKAYNGWDDQSVWDLNGVIATGCSWDGVLPDTVGFGGLCVKMQYLPHKIEKKLSMDLMFSGPGTIVVDSSFYPPGGKWLFAAPSRIGPIIQPEWSGPYKFNVVK
jgi:hypothetical protein